MVLMMSVLIRWLFELFWVYIGKMMRWWMLLMWCCCGWNVISELRKFGILKFFVV